MPVGMDLVREDKKNVTGEAVSLPVVGKDPGFSFLQQSHFQMVVQMGHRREILKSPDADGGVLVFKMKVHG